MKVTTFFTFFGKYLLFPTLVFIVPLLGSLTHQRLNLPAPLVSNSCLVIAALVIMYYERILPFDSAWNQDHNDTWLDIKYILSNIVTVVLIQSTLLFAAFSLFNEGLLKPQIQHVFGSSFIAEFLMFYLCTELLHYGYHWLEHREGFLWKVHEIHHSSERVYLVNSFKMHALETGIRFLFPSLVLIVIGASETAFLVYAIHSSIVGVLQHANISTELNGWNKLFSTADLHRTHHSIVITESNHNFGKSIVLYDLAFGTYSDAGLQNKVGISEKVPEHFWKQFLFPFTRKE